MKRKTDPKTDTPKNKGASVKRVKKDLVATKGPDFYFTPEMRANELKNKSKKLDRTFAGAPAPRVGGKQKTIAPSPNLKTATKKVIRQSKRKPSGSPQARASQKRNNKF